MKPHPEGYVECHDNGNEITENIKINQLNLEKVNIQSLVPGIYILKIKTTEKILYIEKVFFY